MNSLNVLFKGTLVFCFAGISFAQGMEDEQASPRASSFIKNVLIGSAAGIAEVLVNQPTVFVKNLLQQQREVIKHEGILNVLKNVVKKSPAQFYRGLGVNMACMVPTTAAQISISEKLKWVLPGEDMPTSFGRNAIAGGLSALTCNTSELIIVNQQNWKTNAWKTAQRLHRDNGSLVCMRGFMAKALRDSFFCAGFLTAYPMAKECFQKKTGNSIVATLLATASVGPATAAVSHPFDTISTRMQGDPSKKSIQGFIDAAKTVYRGGGSKAFFSGLTPRTARVIVAIPLMTMVKDLLSSDK